MSTNFGIIPFFNSMVVLTIFLLALLFVSLTFFGVMGVIFYTNKEKKRQECFNAVT